MHIEFSGAAREVTGSCHIVHVGGRKVLLDCGLFQGHRHEADAKNRRLPLPVSEIDAIVVSHAHMDHIGRLPFLVHHGYRGPIFVTPATEDLAALLLADSANIQENDAAFLARRGRQAIEPLYVVADVQPTMDRMRPVELDVWFDVIPGIRARYSEAGHILGSASITLDLTEDGASSRVVFSGDVGRWGLSIIRDPAPPADDQTADLVIMESTYGDRDHGSVAGARENLGRVVRETAAKGGRVLIPAFALGRAQELIYDLHSLARDNQIPKIPMIIDSPLATKITTVFGKHAELYDKEESMVKAVPKLFEFDLLRFTQDTNDSKALNSAVGPMVIIAGSGMAESGRILHHLLHGAADPRNTIMIVGYQADGTLGRRIVERRPTLKIFDDQVPLRARVEVLDGYSAHADRTELARWLTMLRPANPGPARVALVHGEPTAQDALSGRLTAQGYTVTCPEPGATFELTPRAGR